MAKRRKGCIPLSTGMKVEKEEEAVINRGLETREAKKRRNGARVSEKVPEGSRATGGSSTPAPWCTSGSRPDCGCANSSPRSWAPAAVVRTAGAPPQRAFVPQREHQADPRWCRHGALTRKPALAAPRQSPAAVVSDGDFYSPQQPPPTPPTVRRSFVVHCPRGSDHRTLTVELIGWSRELRLTSPFVFFSRFPVL